MAGVCQPIHVSRCFIGWKACLYGNLKGAIKIPPFSSTGMNVMWKLYDMKTEYCFSVCNENITLPVVVWTWPPCYHNLVATSYHCNNSMCEQEVKQSWFLSLLKTHWHDENTLFKQSIVTCNSLCSQFHILASSEQGQTIFRYTTE